MPQIKMKTIDGIGRKKVSDAVTAFLRRCRLKNLSLRTQEYGAVEPVTGDSFFLIMPYCNTDCMEAFLQKLLNEYLKDEILLVCDGASWHRENDLVVPDNIHIAFIPPSTPEMNPIEQIYNTENRPPFHVSERQFILFIKAIHIGAGKTAS